MQTICAPSIFTTSTSLSTRLFSFTLSLLRVFHKSVTILRGSSTPIIWNRLLMSFSCKSSSTPSRISPPMILAKAEHVCHKDFWHLSLSFLGLQRYSLTFQQCLFYRFLVNIHIFCKITNNYSNYFNVQIITFTAIVYSDIIFFQLSVDSYLM